jgi:hypothetical protein
VAETHFNGLIQHSFALRIPLALAPAYTSRAGPNTQALLKKLFEVPAPSGGSGGFRLGEAGMAASDVDGGVGAPGGHSLLVTRGQTSVIPRPLPFTESARPDPLPALFSWADDGCGLNVSEDPWKGFVFAHGRRRKANRGNDFLVEPDDRRLAGTEAGKASEVLCQLLAHRRSRLFGLALARGTYNVSLPHALLGDQQGHARWLVQPVISLFRLHGQRGIRPSFSLSMFMIPCETTCRRCLDPEARCGHSDPQLAARAMTGHEIHEVIKLGWALATSNPRSALSNFRVEGPLGGYLAAMKPSVLEPLGVSPSPSGWVCREGEEGKTERTELTLRDLTEATLFGVTLRMVQGSGDPAGKRGREEIGDRVLTALSASRVSSVVAVENNCAKPSGGKEGSCRPAELKARVESLSQQISDPIRTSPKKRYRIDRDFFDRSDYVIGVLPVDRAIVIVADRCRQLGYQHSGLLEAGWLAYMVIGAATATGMIRSIYRDIERADRDNPDSIAEIEREVVVDLHETYDLDITWEAYRNRYRCLRDRLGIGEEYMALNDKLGALYRETSTRFEGETQRHLVRLTRWIVILSIWILVATLVVILVAVLKG